MNYEEAIETTVTKEEAKREIGLHGLSFEDFVLDCGNCKSYKGLTVLNWLGY